MAEDLSIIIEATSEQAFLEKYSNLTSLLKDENIKFDLVEDNVEFGLEKEELLLIAFNFIITSAASGLIWDLVKSLSFKILDNMPYTQRRNTEIRYKINDSEGEIKIINRSKDSFTIKFPDGTKITSENDTTH
ncbi:hypothetical protein [Acaryochloris marina]|uniref:hypothetical protein n=1 Tax=Acaryochloris marina TaxID=155978 RepID=UPI001BB05655|nr:hypothetical protein [Acaryochloris marina]QUY46297.1 hypothetical protein I1H34_31860 [Acaryochloris marina S15]